MLNIHHKELLGFLLMVRAVRRFVQPELTGGFKPGIFAAVRGWFKTQAGLKPRLV
jgi:hypothetical protein